MEQRNGIEGVVVSKWGEDLTKYHVNDSYRCLHAYLVLGDLPSARREYDTLLRRAGEVSEALGQFIPSSWYLGDHASEIAGLLSGND